jgi:hypothetical protein
VGIPKVVVEEKAWRWLDEEIIMIQNEMLVRVFRNQDIASQQFLPV